LGQGGGAENELVFSQPKELVQMAQETVGNISAFEFSVIKDAFQSMVNDEGLPEHRWVAAIENLVVATSGQSEIDPEVIACLVSPQSKLKSRFIDKDKYDRADRESRKIIDAERTLREAKTCRLREQRLASQAKAQTGAQAMPESKRSRRLPH
jgi:hypothetical protein